MAQDLLHTRIPNKNIVGDNEGAYMTMLKFEIVKKSGLHDAEGSRLSMLGDPINANAIRG